MENHARDNLLRSWKEIASYLGVDERTCSRWEHTFSMPVHRAGEGTTKSRVFAYKDELDRWFKETFSVSGDHPPPPEEPASPRPRRLLSKVVIIAIMPVIVVSVFLAIKGMLPRKESPGQPADFHLRGTKLAVVDEAGRELWVRDLGIEGLCTEEKYRNYFQVAESEVDGENLPWVVIKDIDADSRNEVLFSVKRRPDAMGEGILICFDSQGAERWRFHAGREITYKKKVQSGDYRIHGIKLQDINGDGRQEIFVLSFQFPWEPCQLAVLDCQGQVQGEFWNAGYLDDIAFADFNGDGRLELYTVGVNNEYGGGCLAVFDAGDIHGASPQGDRYSFAGLGTGSELYYLDFARSDVSLAEGSIVAGNTRVDATANRRLRVSAHLNLLYEFDANMRCLDVSGGHGFITAYRRLRAEGKIQSTLDDAYYEAVRKRIRYWNGTSWTAEPSMNLRRTSAAQ